MTKQELIDIVNGSTAESDLKEMVIAYIRIAYDAGFQEGMIVASKVQSQAFDMLMNKHEINPHLEKREAL